MSKNVAEILHHCGLFRDVPEGVFTRLAVMSRIRSFAKDEVIFRDGEPCPGVYVLGEGLVKVYKLAPNGKEHVLHLVEPGMTFAEVAAIGGFPCPANAAAIAPAVCVLLPYDAFRAALEADHELCLGMMSGMSLWVRQLIGLMEDVVLRDAAGRIARYLLNLRTGDSRIVEIPGLKRHLANHLNLTSETLSRTLRRLEAAGLISDLSNGKFHLLEPEHLSGVADGCFPKM